MIFTSKSIDKKIKKAIESYYKRKYLSLATLQLDEGLKNYFLKNNSRFNEIDLIDVIIQYRKNHAIDFTFDKFQYELKYLNIEVIGESAYVEVIENHSINYNCCRKISSKMIGLKHDIYLIEVNNEWKLIEDKYNNELDYIINRKRNINSDFKKYVINELNDKVILSSNKGRNLNAITVKKVYKENKSRVTDEYMNSSGCREHFYNRENAVAYAKRYVFKDNDKYKNYNEYGGDCTNFVSQCIHAGGIPFSNEGEHKWYWYSDYNRTPSWTSAKFFREYIINCNGSNEKCGVNAYITSFQDIELGDLVQYRDPTHTMIVTGCLYDELDEGDPWKNKYDILISQHSSDDNGRLLDYPLSLKPEAKGRFYIKVSSYYK